MKLVCFQMLDNPEQLRGEMGVDLEGVSNKRIYSVYMFQGFYQEICHAVNPEHLYCRFMDKLHFLPYHKRRKVIDPVVKFYESVFFKTFFNNGYGKSRLNKAKDFSSKLLKTLQGFPFNAKN